MRVYKQTKKIENPEYERALARTYNKLYYSKKNGLIDNDMYEKYGILYPSIQEIRDQLKLIKLLSKDEVSTDIIEMMNEIFR